MNDLQVSVLPEPELEFRYGQRVPEPHRGLALFGPFDADGPSRPGILKIAVVGTQAGIEAWKVFARCMAGPILAPTDDELEGHGREGTRQFLWPIYPGFEAAFGASWSATPAWAWPLDEQKLASAVSDLDPHKRAHAVVNLYLDALRAASQRDEGYSVLVCVVPRIVERNCRPESRVTEGFGRRPSARERQLRASSAGDLFESYDPEAYVLSVDFRRQLKARALSLGIPLQLVLEPTLATTGESEKDDLSPLSDRAWNLATTLYYKAGGKPWRLATAREGVCYIGLAFRQKSKDEHSRTACCAAQMFLDDGDGIVFLGETGPWYSPEKKEFHLSPESAEKLLTGVLKTYRRQGGRPLREIFLHSHSGIGADEFGGFQKACPSGIKLFGVRVRRDRSDVRLFRTGSYPVLRGTVAQLSDRSALLYSSGFKPDLLTYDGAEVPVPLSIDLQHGEAEIGLVARDILALTKLNYNACRLGESLPVTVGFARQVGEILISNPSVRDARPNFKYYI